jgi:FkbM family methyltransferase
MLSFSDQINGEALKAQINKLDNEVKSAYPITHFFTLGVKNDVCVDLGANVGSFIRYAAPHFKKVYGFEASMTTFSLAKRILQVNKITNAEIYNLASWSKSDEVLKVVKPNYTTTTESKDASVVYQPLDEEFENVTTISLKDIFKLVGTDYIDYLKIDIEGSEYETLLNNDLSNIGVIVGEIHMHPTMPFDGEDGSREMLMKHIKTYFNVLWEAPNNFIAMTKGIKKQ